MIAYRALVVVFGLSAAVAACTSSPKDEEDDTVEVTVRALDVFGDPIPSATVLIHRATGVFERAEVTDGAGQLTATMPAGATVTVMWVSADALVTLRSVVGVQDGDSLYLTHPLNIPAATATPTPAGTASFTLPGTFGGASGHRAGFLASCAQGFWDTVNPVSVPVYPQCRPSTVSVTPVGFAEDSMSAKLAFTVGAPAAPASFYGTTTVLPAWRTDWTDVDIDISGLTSGRQLTGTLTQIDASGGAMLGRAFGTGSTGVVFAATAEMLPLAFAESELLISYADGAGAYSTHRVRSDSGSFSPVVLDVTGIFPLLSPPVIAVEGSSARIEWTAAITDADDLTVLVGWYPAGPTYFYAQWELTAPGDTQPPISLPELPAELAALRPSAADEAIGGNVRFRERSDIADWNDSRNENPFEPPATFSEQLSITAWDTDD